MKKYLIEIFLLTLIAAGIFVCYKYWSTIRDNASASFEPPVTAPAKTKEGYFIEFKFSNPTALHNRILLGQVSTSKGEEDLGEFIVKDIRIWRTDGYRIIKDQIPINNLPTHITVSQKSDEGEMNLFDANIKIGDNILESSDKSVVSKLTVTILKQ